jgi:hypothetical protein
MEIVFGVIFPLTYAIGQAFTRRERCVDVLSQFKAAAVSLAFLHRDYEQTAGERGSSAPLFRTVVQVELELASLVKAYLTHKLSGELHAEDAASSALLARILVCFSTLSVCNERLTWKANYANGGMGRANEYLRALMLHFEQVRAVKKYEAAPVRLAKLCQLMVHISPLLLAPYWRHYCPEYNKSTRPVSVCLPAYLSCTIFCLVLSTMFTVAREVGDPWDGLGDDDIRVSLEEEIGEAVRAPPLAFDSAADVAFPWRANVSH